MEMSPSGPLRIYFLPTLTFFEVHDNVFPLEQLADGRWLMQRWWSGPIYLADLREPGSATPFFEDGAIVGHRPDGLMLLEVPPDLEAAPLWFAPFDGSTPSHLADRVTPYYRLTDGRVLTALNVGEDGLGVIHHPARLLCQPHLQPVTEEAANRQMLPHAATFEMIAKYFGRLSATNRRLSAAFRRHSDSLRRCWNSPRISSRGGVAPGGGAVSRPCGRPQRRVAPRCRRTGDGCDAAFDAPVLPRTRARLGRRNRRA